MQQIPTDKNSESGKFLCIICFITNISQMPILVENELTRFIAIPVWALVFLVCIFKRMIKLNKKLTFIAISSMILVFGILAFTLFTYNDYITPDIVYCYFLSVFIFLIGFWYGDYVTDRGINCIIISYVISSLIIAINIYLKYFRTGFNILSSVYAYDSKNSISQILFTAFVFLITFYLPKKKLMGVIKWCSTAFLLVVILLLKSRATIIGIAILIIVILVTKSNYKIKLSVIAIIAGFAILLLNNNFREIFINGILFAGRGVSNINDISSGRFNEWIAFPKIISGHELIGIGKFKFESFPLSVLAQYGFMIGTIFILVSLWPVIWCLKHLQKSNAIKIILLIIACSYCVNGLFEQLAPFGPGVKCYMLWLMFGMMLRKERINDEI